MKRLIQWLFLVCSGGLRGREQAKDERPDPCYPPIVPWPDPSNTIPSVAHLYGHLPPEEGDEKPTYIFPSKPPDFDPPVDGMRTT